VSKSVNILCEFKNPLPLICNEPLIVVSVFISKPLSGDIEALTLPLTILFKLSPVTPLAGIFVN